jgi:hypothetical protein
MQIVDIPGVGEVEFPDEMGDADIVAAVKRISTPALQASHSSAAPDPGALPPAPGMVESGARGAMQGASLGFGDEVAAAVDAALPGLSRRFNPEPLAASPEDAALQDRYAAARDYYRNRNAAAEQANPGTYLGGQVAGALLTTRGVPVKGAVGVVNAAGLGAAQGAGYSDANEGLGLARDTALGGALGLAGHGAGSLLGGAASKVQGAAGRLLGKAHGRALGQATQEVDEALASARGQLGAETQKGSRYVENLLRFEAAGTLTPAQQAELATLRQAGVVDDLAQSVAQGTLEALPTQAGTIAAKRAALTTATQAAPQTVATRAGELLKPTAKVDTRTFLKSYAEPVIWAIGGQQVGNALGLDPGQQGALATAAGVIGGRTRAGKALYNRLTKPGNQAALARAMERTGQRIGALQRPATAGVPAALIPLLLSSHEESK